MPLYYTYPSTVLKSDQNHKARHMFQRKTKTFKTIQKITKRNKNCLYYTHRHTRTHVHMQAQKKTIQNNSNNINNNNKRTLPGNIPTCYPTMVHQLRPLKHEEAN